jgi:hypothetical protein
MQQVTGAAVTRIVMRICLALGVAALGACASSRPFTGDDVPATLQAGGKPLLRAHAKGVQIYQCKLAKDDNTRAEWVFKAPEATLTDQSGHKIGFHFAGPTWQFGDGSQITGEVVSKWNGPDPTAIPWLLLKVKTRSGASRAGHIDAVQRVHTVGGNAPPACALNQVGEESRVDYSADYFFNGTPR